MPTHAEAEADARSVGVCKYISEDALTYHFQSTDNPEEYHTVDLSCFEGSGECSCPDFQMRRLRLLLDKVVKPHTDRAECKHIKRANKILNFRTKKFLISQRNPNPKRIR